MWKCTENSSPSSTFWPEITLRLGLTLLFLTGGPLLASPAGKHGNPSSAKNNTPERRKLPALARKTLATLRANQPVRFLKLNANKADLRDLVSRMEFPDAKKKADYLAGVLARQTTVHQARRVAFEKVRAETRATGWNWATSRVEKIEDSEAASIEIYKKNFTEKKILVHLRSGKQTRVLDLGICAYSHTRGWILMQNIRWLPAG